MGAQYERRTVHMRRMAVELMRKEGRPICVVELMTYISKMDGGLWGFVRSKSVDYTRAVLGSSAPGQFRRFRCPEWIAGRPGENGRRVYWGECGVRYGSEWEDGGVRENGGVEVTAGGEKSRPREKSGLAPTSSVFEGRSGDGRRPVLEGVEALGGGGEVCGWGQSRVGEVESDSYEVLLREWEDEEPLGRCSLGGWEGDCEICW